MKNLLSLLLVVAPLLIFAQQQDQVINFKTIPVKTFIEYGSFPLGAVSTSGLPITYKSSNTAIVVCSGNSAIIVGAGEAFITATQPGNTSFKAALPVTQRVFIKKATQSIAGGSDIIRTFGNPPFTINFSVSSYLDISYRSSDPSIAAFEGGQMVLKGAGIVSISAEQTGNKNYLPAKTVTRTLYIKKATEDLSLSIPSTVTYGDQPSTLTTTVSSGVISFVSQYDSIAQVIDGKLVIKGAGKTTITAKTPGNTNFLPSEKSFPITVQKAAQSINFGALPGLSFGSASISISATSTSGLPVHFKSLKKSVASVAAGNVTARGIGTAVIVAYQPGNENYLPATEVKQNITVTGTSAPFTIAGQSSMGGANNYGTLFSINSSGSSFTSRYSFPQSFHILPNGGMIKASDNRLYGALSYGGTFGNGAIFSMALDGTGFTIIHSFISSQGSNVVGSLTEASNGYLYGATLFGAKNVGVVFRLKKDGSDFSTIKVFDGNGGYNPAGGVIQASDGLIYGATYSGGSNAYGVLYTMNLDGSGYKEIVGFGGSSRGNTPRGPVLEGPDGFLYGQTAAGAGNGKGCVYKVKKDGTSFTRLIDFNGATTGELGSWSLLIASDGMLYGMTARGGANGKGTIYSIATDGTGYNKLFDFDGTNGAESFSSFVEGSDGFLYGVTSAGGTANLGTAFKIAKNGTGFTTLVNFTGPNGSQPQTGPLLEAQQGKFVGLTYKGGSGDTGTLFSITTTGAYTLIKDFPQEPATPWSLVSGPTHNFGLTIRGGASASGNIFRTLPDGTGYTSIHEFQGDYLFAERLTYMRDNTIWGVGREGLYTFKYSIFKINADGSNFQKVDLLPPFHSRVTAILDYSPEYVYCVSHTGGSSGQGTVFRIKRDLTGLEMLTNIPGGTAGSRPFYPSVIASNGSIFGATLEGGKNDIGTIFKVGTDNVYTKIADFNSTIGVGAQVILALNGGICVATGGGGANGKGTLIIVDENGESTEKIFDFSTQTGTGPSSMIMSNDGYIYVSTKSDGANGKGTIFRILSDGSGYSKLYDYKVGEAADVNTIVTQKQPQTLISFDPIPQKEFLDKSFVLTAVGTGSFPVTFTSSNTNVATIDGNVVTIRGTGTSVISAQLPGIGNYLPSGIIQQTLTVVKSTPTLTFDEIPRKKIGDPQFRLVTTTNSGLPVSFKITNTSIATIAKGNAKILSNGTTTITASIASNPNFNNVAPIQREIIVDKGNNVITFDPLAERFVDSNPFTVVPTSSAGVGVTLATSDPSIAEITGFTIKGLSEGQATITARSAGNALYNDADDVTRELKLLRLNQTILFDTLQARAIDDGMFVLQSVGSTSTLPVSLTIDSNKAKLSNDTVTLLSPGKVTIHANQSGDLKFNTAPAISRTFCINPPAPSFTENLSSPERPVLTSNSTTGNQWFKNGVLLAGKNQPTIVVDESGTYTLSVSIEGCASKKSEGRAYVVTGFEEEVTEVMAYPNPTASSLFIELPNNPGSEIIVYDIIGREQQKVTSTSSIVELNVTALSPGQYVLKVVAPDRVFIAKFKRQ